MAISKIVLEYISVLIWPITIFVIIFIFREIIEQLFNRVQKASFPGGISIETFPDDIQQAKIISKMVQEENRNKENSTSGTHPSIPLNEANTKMINFGLSPSPYGLELDYYKNLANQDPNLSLAGLRMELEIMLKNLAKGFSVEIKKYDSASTITRKLKDKGAVTSSQADLIYKIITLANAAVHGVKVTKKQANEILEVSEILRDQYLSWLSWGFKSI